MLSQYFYHLNDWKEGKPFTQNKCLLQFKEWCRIQHKHFKTVIDVGAWAGTWAYEGKILSSDEPWKDDIHYTYKCFSGRAEIIN